MSQTGIPRIRESNESTEEPHTYCRLNKISLDICSIYHSWFASALQTTEAGHNPSKQDKKKTTNKPFPLRSIQTLINRRKDSNRQLHSVIYCHIVEILCHNLSSGMFVTSCAIIKGIILHEISSLFSALYVNPKTQTSSQGRADRSYMQSQDISYCTLCMPSYEINKMIYECDTIYRITRCFCKMQPQTISLLYQIRNIITV